LVVINLTAEACFALKYEILCEIKIFSVSPLYIFFTHNLQRMFPVIGRRKKNERIFPEKHGKRKKEKRNLKLIFLTCDKDLFLKYEVIN
jgi:hypothetical protein